MRAGSRGNEPGNGEVAFHPGRVFLSSKFTHYAVFPCFLLPCSVVTDPSKPMCVFAHIYRIAAHMLIHNMGA